MSDTVTDYYRLNSRSSAGYSVARTVLQPRSRNTLRYEYENERRQNFGGVSDSIEKCDSVKP